MKLSVVIVCWNGMDLIDHCLRSIFAGTQNLDFEVIISDNGSSDGSVEFVQRTFPQVRLIENGSNLGYAKGNNLGICECRGEYVLLLNSDTVVHQGALEKLVGFADLHPEGGAFGCEVLNPDGSRQVSARRFPTLRSDWLDAFGLSRFATRAGQGRTYKDRTCKDRTWHSGCCLLFRSEVLRRLGGFDEQFFYSYEDVDLCWRVWDGGYSIVYTSEARITHLGSQSANRSPLRFELERHRSRYRYFNKRLGKGALASSRNSALARLSIRLLGYRLLNLFAPSEALRLKIKICSAAAEWNRRPDPVRFVEFGEEPPLSSGEWDALPNLE